MAPIPKDTPTMSDTNLDHEQDQADVLAGLREAASKGKAAITENEQLRKELLFARAGIDTETKLGKLLFRTFEGTDVNELKTEAAELGIAPASSTPPPAARGAQDDEQDQADFRRTFSGGDAPDGRDEGPHPLDDALGNFYADVKRGTPRESAALAAIDRILVAGANGDKRVIFDPRAFSQEAAQSGSGARG
jgi:ribosomal protein L12E/L44/L45/RPP1/RPP2